MKRRDLLYKLGAAVGSLPLSSLLNAQMLGRLIAVPAVTVFRIPTIAGPAFSALPAGYPLEFSSNVKSGAPLVFDWGDGTIDVSNNPSHLYADNSRKVITVSSTDGWSGLTEFEIQLPNGNRSPFTNGIISGGTVLDMNGSTLPPFSFLHNLQGFRCCDTWYQGAFPHQSMSFAPGLTHFDIQGNDFSGLLPDFSGNPALEYCDIHYSGWQGRLPSFANCTNLTFFRSYVNGFTGPLPSFAACVNLVTFGFVTEGSAGDFGTMPSFATCTLLQTFEGSGSGYGDGYTGTIPDFSPCTLLTSFTVRGNMHITGVTHGSLATQPNLNSIDFDQCSLTTSEVNAVLADLYTSLSLGGRVACTVVLTGGGQGAPSGAGLTAKAALIAAGWTVTTN